MEKHVYFVRHGQSEENLDHVLRGRDAQLTEEGKKQADVVAERIERIGVDALISSPFPRALDTAVNIGERIGINPEQNALFGEWVEPSNSHGKHRDHPERKNAHQAIIAATDDHNYRHADEETFAELVGRAQSAICMIEQHPAERICVVTHGGFLRVVIGAMVFGTEFSKKNFVRLLYHFYTTNTGITYVRYTNETPRWQLVTWNDQSHLG